MKKQFFQNFIFLVCMLSFFLMLACSSDLLNPPEAPIIERIEASSYEVDPGDTITVKVIVKEANGDVLKYTWSSGGGSFIPPTDEVEARWIAPDQGGAVTLRVKVSNEDKSADETVSITVRSYTKPQVEIITPKSGAFIIQNSRVNIEVRARHNNGIRRVDFYVADSLYNPAYFSEDIYRLEHRFDHPAGPLWIVAKATANVTGAVGTDSVQVWIEGIILGKPRN